ARPATARKATRRASGSASPARHVAFILIPRIPLRLVVNAFEVIGICRVADRIPSDLRERTQWPLELDAACRSVVDVVRGNDLFWGNTLLYPAFESFQEVVIGIDHRCIVRAVAKSVRAVSTAAMRHPRYHEEPIEFLDFLPSVALLPARFNACQLRPDT